MKEIELIGKRKPREKHFLKKNGIIEAQVFDEDIHFFKDGTYEEIDNTLIDIGNYYTNKNNAYKVSFAKISKDELTCISIGDNYIKTKLVDCNLSPLTENITESKLHKNVCYPNIIDNVDLEYNIMPAKVKEAIVLKNKDVDLEKLVFVIETNLELQISDKKIVAKKEGKVCFEFDAPYMIDAEFKTNNNINYELSKISEIEYLLKLNVDENWLNDEKTKYPVMIDPTITNSDQNNSVYDTYIYPGDTDVDRNSQDILKVGVERINGTDRINRALLKFELPTIGTGSQVISASIDIYGYPEAPYNYNTDWVTIHQITSPWDETTANWDVMNDKYNPLVEGIMEAGRGYYDYQNQTIHPAYCYADITRLVRKWYTGIPNNGLMLKLSEEKYNSEVLPSFYSKNNSIIGGNPKPLLTISYRNQNGIEEYMNYKVQDFSIGKAYVNTYNGNLTTMFNVGETIGSKLPISLNLVYNTNDVVLKNDIGYGVGYRFDYHQTVRERTIGEKKYLEYTDEDGTLHYFLNQKITFDDSGYNTIDTGNVYYDEDGLNMTFTKNNDDYILNDKNGNIMNFAKKGEIAYLSKIEDVSGNKNIITYNEDNKIIKIIDSNNFEVNLSYSNDTITIISPNENVVLRYLNNKLINIECSLGQINFEYNDNDIISSIMGINGIKIVYDYYSGKPYKVKKITEYGSGNVLGEYFDILYGFDSTTVIDSKDNAKNMIFNEQGGLVSVSSLKTKDDITNAYGISQINGVSYGTNQGSNNKLLRIESPLKYVKNLLSNTSFEEDVNYFPGGPYSTTSISDEVSNTGLKSLKIVSHSYDDQIIAYNSNSSYQKGKYYTFSCYVKSTNKLLLQLRYEDKDNQAIEAYSDIINPSDEFERHDVTIYYPEDANSGLFVRFNIIETGTAYIDDVQLEEGEVANNYNLIENSDFSDGLSNWELEVLKNGENVSTSGYFDIVDTDNNVKALRVKTDPIHDTIFSKKFNISGKGGDVFNLSFWYKNEGINSNLSEYYGSRAYVSFNYINQDDGHCAIPSPILNPNDDAWQYISNDFMAEKDYNFITVDFHREYDVNDLYITNLSLFKDIRNVYYDYDEFGNVILENNYDNKDSSFNYDKNNQLVQMMDPKGKNFMIEYDNIITDRVINGISDMGISNKIKYDKNNNPVLTKFIKNNIIGELSNGLYKIRLKGSDKYLRNICNEIKVKDEDCCHDIWFIEKSEQYFKIGHSIMTDKYFTIQNNKIILSSEGGNNSLFELNRNKNGSYCIKLKTESENNGEKAENYIKYNNEGLEFSEFIEDDYHFEFYFETVCSKKIIENKAEYTEDGKFLEKTIDALGNITIYYVDENTGLTNYSINSNNHKTIYDYNDKKQLVSVTEGRRKVSCEYNNKNLLSKVLQGNKEYNLEYDGFTNLNSIKIGNNILLATKTYDTCGRNLESISYGNGSTINYEYDDFNRIKKITKENANYNYKYNSVGDLVKVLSDDGVIKYTYDLSKRLSGYRFNDFVVKYEYDINDDILKTVYSKNNKNFIVNNEYNKDELINKITCENNTINYTYDELDRVVNVCINDKINYSYKYISNGNRTSTIINSVKINNVEYLYKYDKLYNIKTIYRNGVLTNKYYYDEFEELIKEKNYIEKKIINYSYNTAGNIKEKNIYDLYNYNLLETSKFEYNNTDWEDQLTKINDDNIIYDSIGNPIKIGNNDLSWINGRQLSSYSDSNNLISYKYDVDGIRVSKKINDLETRYYLEGTNIVLEETPAYMIYFIRGADDKLLGFKYNDEMYYYIRNLQDDIIEILDSMYNTVAKYDYNSWGEVVSIIDGDGNDISNDINHIGNINPFRYRSYYYDKETKLYYLNSRYYNPKWGRFLNADNYLSTDYKVLGSNMYIYCNNNYINEDDHSGHGIGLAIIVGVSALVIAFAANTKKKKKKAAAEINKNQKKKKEVKDQTKKINQKLEQTKKSIQKDTAGKNFVQKLQIIREKATDGAEYDLKLQDEWDETVVYDGHVMEAQDVGNFHFGYMGRAAGIPLEILKLGAGANQLKKYKIKTLGNCISESYCDDMRDTFYITLGALKYDSEN